MDALPHTLDWSLYRSFLAVAETGSLSAASMRLSQSQPTLGRHIKQLEVTLGLTLFERHTRGLTLTQDAEKLLAPARAMQAAAAQLSLVAAGQETQIGGTVRITASNIMARHILPQIIADLRVAEPEIEIELTPTDATENLLFREADIAVRMYRPTQLDVITKQVGEAPLGVYAATSYLDRAGRDVLPETIGTHDIVGYDRDDRILRGMRALGLPATQSWFSVRCDDQNTYWELVCAGCGLGFAQTSIGDADPRVERLLPELDMAALPIWLTAPEAMRHTPRIRRVWDALEAGLSARFS